MHKTSNIHIIKECANCDAAILKTDKILIPITGDEENVICSACFTTSGWATPGVEYVRCTMLKDVYCPVCLAFFTGFISDRQFCLKCSDCNSWINIISYLDALKKK